MQVLLPISGNKKRRLLWGEYQICCESANRKIRELAGQGGEARGGIGGLTGLIGGSRTLEGIFSGRDHGFCFIDTF